MKTATQTNNPHSPYPTDPKEIVAHSIKTYVGEVRKFNNGDSIPKFDVTFDLPQDLTDLSADDIRDLMEDLSLYKCDLEEFIEKHDLPEGSTACDIQDAEDKYCIDGTIYEDAYEYINSEFLDWGYHRMHGDTNVIQFLTHFGGPAGGFWIDEDGELTYWTAWWSSPTSQRVTGHDKLELMEFFRTYSECMAMIYHGDNHEFSGEGLDDGIIMLAVASRDRDEEQESE